jgi:hypothetical protein
MAMKRSGAAGGINSNKVTHREAYKVEPKPKAINPAAVNRLGNMHGTHTTEGREVQGAPVKLGAGKGYQTPVGPTVAECKPGGGRTVSHCGSQGQHGEVSGQKPSPGRPIDGPTPFANRKEY